LPIGLAIEGERAMSDLRISDMLQYQRVLLEKHKDNWDPHIPENGRNSLLWCIDEIGEIIAIIKKKGEQAIMENEHVRAHFVEECSDVMMYFVDMLDCYGISAEEFSEAFEKKAKRNLNRTWEENDAMYED
jgi:NTP pyrophosphatase (non-canonical NTP hydrolase)